VAGPPIKWRQITISPKNTTIGPLFMAICCEHTVPGTIKKYLESIGVSGCFEDARDKEMHLEGVHEVPSNFPTSFKHLSSSARAPSLPVIMADMLSDLLARYASYCAQTATQACVSSNFAVPRWLMHCTSPRFLSDAEVLEREQLQRFRAQYS
jgi:hypothetical protein